jgi:hypothetical protein
MVRAETEKSLAIWFLATNKYHGKKRKKLDKLLFIVALSRERCVEGEGGIDRMR